jgi:hypothetical protein
MSPYISDYILHLCKDNAALRSLQNAKIRGECPS